MILIMTKYFIMYNKAGYCLLWDLLPPLGCFQGALPPLPLCWLPVPLPKLACCAWGVADT